MKNKVMKETISVLKEMIDMNDEMNTTEVQFYITDDDGFILELRIGIDEDEEIYKQFNTHNSAEELDELREEEAYEISENTLLN